MNTLSHSSMISNDDCPASPVTNTKFTNKKCNSFSGSHSFIHCSWDNSGLTSNGGAIHCAFSDDTQKPSISLTIEQCIFSHCHETSTECGGGAVSAEYISAARIESSYFYDCECGANSSLANGGGVLLNYLYSYPSIRRCSFLSCVSGDDGGGCGIWYCNSSVMYVVDSCRFIQCSAVDASSSAGGGLMIAWNEDSVTITNCLFYSCSCLGAIWGGGGIWINRPSNTDVSPITFSFFCQNIAEKGRDVLLVSFPSSPQAIIHSFSFEAQSGRLEGGPDDWLPLASLGLFVSELRCDLLKHKQVSQIIILLQKIIKKNKSI